MDLIDVDALTHLLTQMVLTSSTRNSKLGTLN